MREETTDAMHAANQQAVEDLKIERATNEELRKRVSTLETALMERLHYTSYVASFAAKPVRNFDDWRASR